MHQLSQSSRNIHRRDVYNFFRKLNYTPTQARLARGFSELRIATFEKQISQNIRRRKIRKELIIEGLKSKDASSVSHYGTKRREIYLEFHKEFPAASHKTKSNVSKLPKDKYTSFKTRRANFGRWSAAKWFNGQFENGESHQEWIDKQNKMYSNIKDDSEDDSIGYRMFYHFYVENDGMSEDEAYTRADKNDT